MNRPLFTVGDIFRAHAETYQEAHPTSGQERKVMRALMSCRTAALGGHMEQCDGCGHKRNAYNSCRNRHCPNCQSLARARWLADRKAELLPVHYFHVVFTVPDSIAALAYQNKRVLYDILFKSAAATLNRIAANPKHLGADIGFFAVLHTWGQNLQHHPHVHCVVPGGGLSPDGRRWVSTRKRFFLPVRVLSRLFRGLFLDGLKTMFEARALRFFGDLEHLSDPAEFTPWLKSHFDTEWVVYAKRPFGGPVNVIEYLGHYTHRVAISNRRLVNVTKDQVTFRYKDYRKGHAGRLMTVTPHEFMRRYLLHTLPSGFMRIRHYGFLANRNRREKLTRCRELLNVPPPPPKPVRSEPIDWKAQYELLTGEPIDLCPVCRVGRMVPIPEPYAQLPQRLDSS